VDRPYVKIHIDYQRLSSILGILTQVSTGEASPLFIEERVRELQEYVPFLPTAISWMAEAMDRVSKAKDGDIANDPKALREFLLHQDMLNRAQGALAALLCAGESLRSESFQEKQASTPKRTTKGTTKKGKRDVRRQTKRKD